MCSRSDCSPQSEAAAQSPALLGIPSIHLTNLQAPRSPPQSLTKILGEQGLKRGVVEVIANCHIHRPQFPRRHHHLRCEVTSLGCHPLRHFLCTLWRGSAPAAILPPELSPTTQVCALHATRYKLLRPSEQACRAEDVTRGPPFDTSLTTRRDRYPSAARRCSVTSSTSWRQ